MPVSMRQGASGFPKPVMPATAPIAYGRRRCGGPRTSRATRNRPTRSMSGSPLLTSSLHAGATSRLGAGQGLIATETSGPP